MCLEKLKLTFAMNPFSLLDHSMLTEAEHTKVEAAYDKFAIDAVHLQFESQKSLREQKLKGDGLRLCEENKGILVNRITSACCTGEYIPIPTIIYI